MKNSCIVARSLSLFLSLVLALGIVPIAPTAAVAEAVTILSVTNDSGTTYISTDKASTCITIKDKVTGETWTGTTDLYGMLTLKPGRALDEDDLEASTCSKPSAQRSDVATVSGVVTVALNTDSGQPVKLTLPADMRAGDTISGTVDEVSLQRTGDTLEGAVVDIGGKKHPLRNRILTFVVPAAAGIALPIILKDRSGREIAREQIPVQPHLTGNIPTQLGNLTGSIPTQLGNLSNFHPPRIGQVGRELAIAGKFDGLAETTTITIGQQSAEFLAESPRSTFVKVPANAPPGATLLTVEEGVPGRAPVRKQFKFHTVAVDLSANKLHLTRGESTQLRATVRGVQGLEAWHEQIELRVQNLSPQVVRFHSTKGDLMIVKVTAIPDQMDGTRVFSEQLTGLRAGAFSVRATLTAPLPAFQDEPTCFCNEVKLNDELKALPLGDGKLPTAKAAKFSELAGGLRFYRHEEGDIEEVEVAEQKSIKLKLHIPAATVTLKGTGSIQVKRTIKYERAKDGEGNVLAGTSSYGWRTRTVSKEGNEIFSYDQSDLKLPDEGCKGTCEDKTLTFDAAETELILLNVTLAEQPQFLVKIEFDGPGKNCDKVFVFRVSIDKNGNLTTRPSK
ncbi:MAG TPA: hypothetical protein VFZ34_09565 [Blastocatellia bacterium]|nr:hypothetical protein [Blastocatellia bacterium]